MLSPTPFSLFCALLLCLPLAVIFTITTPTTTTPTTIPTTAFPQKPTNNNTPFSILVSSSNTTKTHPQTPNITTNSTPSPPSPPPPPPPPPIRVDYEEDELLLRVAARVNSRPKSPLKKLAFLFLTTTPLPFSRLWQLYFNTTPTNLYNIYIHADHSFSYNSPFRGVFAHRVIPSKPTRRLTPTLASAARRLLAHALVDDPSNSHFALLSASCIPLRSFNFTYQTLISSNKSFVEILENEPGAYDRWAARGEDAMVPAVEFEDFRIGSQFWVLTRKHAKVVVSDRRVWAKFKLPCLNLDTCYPEEQYFPTLLNMVDPRGCVPATLTHVDWRERHDGHPRTYVAREMGPELILRLRSDRPRYGDDPINGSDSSVVTRRHDPFLFARKFSPKSLQPLMSMANDIIFKD